MRGTSIQLLCVFACFSTACGPTGYSTGDTVGYQGQVVAGTGGGQQYIYVPTTNIPVSAVQQVVVQSADGRQFRLGQHQVQTVAAGRMALSIPTGVTQGNIVIHAGGTIYPAIPFYVATPMTTQISTAVVVSPTCTDISGTWTGNISDSDPHAVATAVIQLGADCRSVSGFIHWEGPGIGSVDSTIAGVWDPNTNTLVASDTQLFNVRPRPGGGFCPTERYQLTLSPDGRTLTGMNMANRVPPKPNPSRTSGACSP